ncbi:MAG: AMP-binding protein [Propioniciclava sp.]|uniref:AMP-binding protein n=1 Tax=Propioniciclava sp. TaxID=2038686 RepID=UPI0039E55950
MWSPSTPPCGWGAVVVEHNPLYTERELRHLFEDHGARVVIAWDAAVEKLHAMPGDVTFDRIVAVNLLRAFPLVKRLALGLPVPKLRATRNRLTRPASGTMSWERLLSAPRLPAGHPHPSVNDVAVIQYTSGTTGQPKGAMLTHKNLFSNALQGEAWMHGAQYREEVFYAILPMFHAFGMTLFLTYGVLKQGRLVLFPSFDVDLVLDAARKHPPTVYCAVPPIYEATARRAQERGISLRAAKYCISGAMTLPDSTVELWESVSGGLLVEGYGMTEASPVCLGNPFAPSRRTGTIGLPFPSTWMRVVDTEDPARDVAPGERGELLIRGPQVFGGYWRNDEETAKTLLPGGWLRTGDVVVVDADGFTTLVDRVKELIITGGFNVAPSEVEQVLALHSGVRQVAVVGVPNAEHGGERVVAAIVGEPEVRLSADDLRAWCKERLTGYKVPRAFYLVDALPTSMLGKVLRASVREQIAPLTPMPLG